MNIRNIRNIRDIRDRHRLLFSVVLVTVLLMLTWAFIPVTFESNDDAFLMSFLSGAKTGRPEADTVFNLFLWGKIVSSLYLLNAGIPWYPLVFSLLIALSLITVCYCVVVSFPKWGGSLFCLLYFCMFSYYSVIFQYTVVSAYCGVAAASLLLTDQKAEDRKHVIGKNIMIFSFTFFAANLRKKVGVYLLLGNAVFIICLEILRYFIKAADRQKIKKMLFSFLTMCAAAGIAVVAHDIRYKTGEWETFQEYKSERVQFTDYAKLDYESNKDLFDKIGWSEDFYELVKRWFFMDKSVNAETLGQINEHNVKGSIRVGRSLLHEWFPAIEFQVKVWVLLLAFLLADAVIHREKRGRRSIVSFLWLFIWFAETQYFGYSGRIIERAFETWTLFAVVASVLGSAAECRMEEDGKKYIAESIAIPVIFLALCVACTQYPSGGYRRAKAFSSARDAVKITQANMEDYVMEHPENIYIYGTSLPGEGDPWRVYKKGQPYNLMFWGGAFYNSPLYYAQLNRNGRDHLFTDDFFEDNVYFIARKEPDENLRNVMEEKFPGCTYEVTDEKDGFIVYKYLK